ARGDSSCSVLRPASRWLVVRRRRSFSRSVVASWGIQSWQFWGSRLFELCAHLGSRCCPSMLRRNRLTSHSSGRLRRRLIQALVGSSCWFFVWCVSPSFALACRPSPPQLFAQHRCKLGHSELVILGQSVVQAARSSRQSLSPEHAASQPSNISFKA